MLNSGWAVSGTRHLCRPSCPCFHEHHSDALRAGLAAMRRRNRQRQDLAARTAPIGCPPFVVDLTALRREACDANGWPDTCSVDVARTRVAAY
eukprot:6185493-Pleurochrysis_carterae.AAC.2